MGKSSFDTKAAHLAESAPAVLDRALRTGGSYADLFYERTVHHRLTLRQQAGPRTLGPPGTSADRQVVEGAAVHVLGPSTAGFAATEDLSAAALHQAAEEARVEAWGAAQRSQVFTAMDAHLDLPPDAPDAVAETEKMALLRAAAEAAFALDERIHRVEATYRDFLRHVLVATSEGALRAKATLHVGLHVAVTMQAERGAVTAYAVAGGAEGFGLFFSHSPEQVARTAVERAQILERAEPMPSGSMPVVLAAGWGGVWLHEAVGHLLEADVSSPLDGCMGEAVAVPSVTLVDDATWPGGRGTYPFDDEGTTAGRTALIQDGILLHRLTDRCHAGDLAGLPTGNGRRQDFRHPPLPRMTNLLLLAGESDPADLLAGIKTGLYVQRVGHGVVQPQGGFAFDVLEGYRIEHGRCTAPVTSVQITGNGPDVLHGLVGMGNDLQVDTARGLCKKAGQVLPVSVGMPTVLVERMHVAPKR